MARRGLNNNLLEGQDFNTLSQDVQVNLNDIQYSKESILEIADSIKNNDKITDGMLRQYKGAMRKLDNLFPQTEHLLDQLSNVCYSQKEQNIAKKL